MNYVGTLGKSYGLNAKAAESSLAGSCARLVAKSIGPILVLLMFLLMWQLVSSTLYADQEYLVPRPMSVLHAATDNHTMLLVAARTTMIESLTGFGLAIVVGVLGAVLMSQSQTLERGFYPWAIVLQTVPVVAIAPIIVLWFGYGTTSVVIVAMIISLFPILNNTLLGLKSADRNHLDLFGLHTRNRVVRFVKLELPGATPSIIAGLKISAGLSVVGAIVGEFLIGSGGSQGGLGVKVIFSQAQLNTPLLFAEVAAATMLGILFFLIVTSGGYLFLRTWHESVLRSER